jgi:hypothetical protein
MSGPREPVWNLTNSRNLARVASILSVPTQSDGPVCAWPGVRPDFGATLVPLPHAGKGNTKTLAESNTLPAHAHQRSNSPSPSLDRLPEEGLSLSADSKLQDR